MESLICKDESYAIIGACMKVHSTLGQGFKEFVYGDALELEFIKQGIPFEREPQYQITYEGQVLKHVFQPDFVCFGNIVVEIKAVKDLDDGNREQCINYVHASRAELGLLINFRAKSLIYERFPNFEMI
jgi:GxxExxY protein